MAELVFRSAMTSARNELYQWHERPGAFERLSPPWTPVTLEQAAEIRDGSCAIIRLAAGPFGIRWFALHHDVQRGHSFTDTQKRGPFRLWTHRHSMLEDGANSILEDKINWELPFDRIARPLVGGLARKQLDAMFRYRHRVTRMDLERHALGALSPLRVAISGSSGTIGRVLAAILTTGGHEVVRLVRTKTSSHANTAYWNPESGEIEREQLEGLDAFIHLAGAPIHPLRWGARQKERVARSRIDGTTLISETLAQLQRPPSVLIGASGVHYYGYSRPEAVSEASGAGSGFLAKVVAAWEDAYQPASDAGIRVVQARFGAVLTPGRGLLKYLMPPIRLGLGGWVGDGTQEVPWVGLDDACYAVLHCLANEGVSGPVNVVSPQSAPMKRLVQSASKVVNRKARIGIPKGLVRCLSPAETYGIAAGHLSVTPAKLLQSEFKFQLPDPDQALAHMLGGRLASDLF